MCRLMGFASTTDTSMETMAGQHYEQFAILADRHKDGWGFASDARTLKEVLPARKSKSFDEVTKDHNNGALLHFRFASTGISIQESNSHPFTRDGISFIHNGTIKPASTLDTFVAADLLDSVTGSTDSEKYFLAILTALRSTSLKDAFLQTVRKIKATGNYSSLNAMLLSPDYYLVVSEHDNNRIPKDEPADYYKLSFKTNTDGVIVASSGWDQTGWSEIPNHTMLVVDRRTLALDFISI